MTLLTARDVLKVTGLSADQLREWTTRRGLIRPDAVPHGPGSRAKYAWHTVLLLRVAVVLKETFHVELQAHHGLLNALGGRLAKTSFPALRGMAVVIRGGGVFDIVAVKDIRNISGDSLILELDSHLDALSIGFGVAEPRSQLQLFPAVAVR